MAGWESQLGTERGEHRRTSHLQIHLLQRKQSMSVECVGRSAHNYGVGSTWIPWIQSEVQPFLTCTAACMRISILFIIFSSQAWTHGSTVHPSCFMSGWARKTEGNMRMLITMLTPRWTEVTPSSRVILTGSREDKDSTETRGNVKRGRKCPTFQHKFNPYSLL